MEQLILVENEQTGVDNKNQVTDIHYVNDAKDDVDDNKENKIFEYDVFISYSKSDRPWVKDFLLQTLEQQGKKVCIDYRDFPAGLAVTDNIVHAVESSHVTILVLTPTFVESEWCMFESKRALLSSLTTTRARVLPLILMECKIPNILTHLTYLDHTSEDVQPYFKEQLIDSLDKAKTWSPKTGESFGSDIIPITDVVNVVNSTLEHKRLCREHRESVIRRIISAFFSFNSMSCKIQSCVCIPYLVVLASYFIFMIMGIVVISRLNYINAELSPNSTSSTSSHIFQGFNLRAEMVKAPIIKTSMTFSCQSIQVTKRYVQGPIMVDVYAFKEPANQVIYARKTNMIHNETCLPQKRLFKQKRFRIYGNVSVTAKFCFQSANPDQNATLWIYKLQNTDETEDFDTSSEFNPENVFVKHTEYTVSANQTYCNVAVMKGQKLQDNEYSNFVFYNPGPSMIFLNVSTTMKIPSYKANLAKHSCLNASECEVPSPNGFIIVAINISIPTIRELNDITVKCIYKTPVVLYYVAMVAIFVFGCLLLHTLRKIYNKKCVRRLRSWYFQREKVRKKIGQDGLQILDEEYADVHAFQKNVI